MIYWKCFIFFWFFYLNYIIIIIIIILFKWIGVEDLNLNSLSGAFLYTLVM